jgi:transaldolase
VLVNALDYDGMIKEGEELADLHEQIVKIAND